MMAPGTLLVTSSRRWYCACDACKRAVIVRWRSTTATATAVASSATTSNTASVDVNGAIGGHVGFDRAQQVREARMHLRGAIGYGRREPPALRGVFQVLQGLRRFRLADLR